MAPFVADYGQISRYSERKTHECGPQGEKAEADMEYRGESTKIDLPEVNIFGSNTKRTKALMRLRHEKCN